MSERLQISRTLSLELRLAMRMCLKIFAVLFLLTSLTCDANCALKTRATPPPSHTPTDNVVLCKNRLVH
jgi:hypothetical protein